MKFTVATWNINSVRIRTELICRFLHMEKPDVLCLQELKSPTELFLTDSFEELGYNHCVKLGQKSYNGVAILSRLPMREAGAMDLLGNGDARHIAAELECGIFIENFYVPAGGYEPNREINPKFGEKLDYVAALRDWGSNQTRRRTILVGDLNIAPLEDDVWSHRQLLNVVSHTPIEVNLLNAAQDAGHWVDVVRSDMPQGKLYSWWSYRSPNWDLADKGRRLDHIWVTPDLALSNHGSRILRHVRGWERPSDHVPVIAEFEI